MLNLQSKKPGDAGRNLQFNGGGFWRIGSSGTRHRDRCQRHSESERVSYQFPLQQ